MFGWGRGRIQRQGVATVELAIVLPILLALLFAIIEFGFLFKDQLIIQQAAREGARTAALGRTLSEIQARIMSAAATLNTSQLTYDVMFRTYNSGVWSAWTTLANQPDDSGTNNAPQGAQIRVRINYVHPFLTGPLFARLLGRPGESSMTLRAEMIMRRE